MNLNDQEFNCNQSNKYKYMNHIIANKIVPTSNKHTEYYNIDTAGSLKIFSIEN